MSTTYNITKDFEATESSCDIYFTIDSGEERVSTRHYDKVELETLIVNLVRAAAYCQEDPNAFMERFNVGEYDYE